MLHPGVGSSVQEGHRSAGASPERVTEVIRGLEHLSSEHRLKAGVVQFGEKKAAGTTYTSLPVPK